VLPHTAHSREGLQRNVLSLRVIHNNVTVQT
jgi:hypothetical protein